jgi:murein DD-endopeptidase MepM/ murein hydrolase activator NlpD
VHRQLALRRPYLRGPDVAAVQRALGGLVVDGIYGPLTATRVRTWERAAGRPADGILTRREQRLLLAVIAPLDTPPGRGSEFALVDPQGAPADDGQRYHAGKDWFAPGGSPVRAPVAGLVVEARVNGDRRGQIFGGTVKIQDVLGRVWVFRHVDPRSPVTGRLVESGEIVATVTPWRDGPAHAHIEVWKTLAGGYDFENMLDPMSFFG